MVALITMLLVALQQALVCLTLAGRQAIMSNLFPNDASSAEREMAPQSANAYQICKNALLLLMTPLLLFNIPAFRIPKASWAEYSHCIAAVWPLYVPTRGY